ncbi:MAG: N-acetyltransferase [Lentisphaerae bacterium]|nr:N-acetyltransferase [Lentisphaerota bacterium]MCP4103516.1 N-acetyltransferase [Lentisphaerota bacterium]
MEVRFAGNKDLPAIVEIYNQAIEEKNATADITPIELEDRLQWLKDHSPDRYPVWVVEKDGAIAGWCSLSPYRPGRMALRYAAEISYYVHRNFRRQGIASVLTQKAIDACERLDLKTLFAILFEINTGSTRLLEKFGFESWGRMPDIADIDGKEISHVIYGLRVR